MLRIAGYAPGGENVLFAVAAVVIGGTSLFGGRGKMPGAVLGAAPQFMWTTAVLLAAVTTYGL